MANSLNRIKHHITRNPFTVSATLLGVVGGVATIPLFIPSPAVGAINTHTFTVPITVVPTVKPVVHRVSTMSVDLTYLKNAKVGGMGSAYLGHSFKDSKGNIIPLPDRATINFADNLQHLWKRKLAISNVSGAAKKNAEFIVSRYRASDPDLKGIKTFVLEIDTAAKIAHSSIAFVPLCDKMRVKPVQCAVLRSITGRIEGKQLAAYGMTEIMPSHNGNFNYIMLDTLLRNAGEGFVQSVPALGDGLLSLGFYQLTSHAVYEVDTAEGASYVNKFVANKDAKIPGSVVALTGAAHHRAAFYFATYNFGRLLQKLNEKDAIRLGSGACPVNDLTQFIATAHHMPTLAINKAASWIRGGCRKPIVDYMGPHLKLYAKKTRLNLNELEARL